MALHLPTGSLKTHSGLEPVPRCEPSIYHSSPYANDIATAPSGTLKTNNNNKYITLISNNNVIPLVRIIANQLFVPKQSPTHC